MMISHWEPKHELLQEVISLLQAYMVPNNAVQRESYQRLQQFQENLEFNLYLVHLFSNREMEVNVRQLAGLLLKKNIKNANVGVSQGKSPMEMEILALIRMQTLSVLNDETRVIRMAAGSIITTFVSQYTFLDEWPELLPALTANLNIQSMDYNATAGAFGALRKICEDSAVKLDHSPSRPLNTLIPKLLEFFNHPNGEFRRDALECLNAVLLFLPVGLVVHMDDFLRGISQLTNDPEPQVRKLVCKSIVALLEVGVQYLVPHMESIIQFILRSNQEEDESIAIEACEFWASFCDLKEFDELRQLLLPHLTTIIPLLFQKMVYSEEDLAQFEADDQAQQANVPDRPEDIRPVFHRRNMGGNGGNGQAHDEDDEEDDDEDDDDDDEALLQWNLRRCSAAALDNLAIGYGEEILPTLFPLLQERLALPPSPDPALWSLSESAILALGAIAEGCHQGITPHLSTLFPFLLQKLEDPIPLIRSISCWTLSRYVDYVLEQGDASVLSALVENLLKRISDPHKKVQEAACSAFCTLEEEARDELIPFLQPILQNLMYAMQQYQAKNLLILYDAIGTLADSVRRALNQPELISILMPPLIHKWETLGDQDRELLPLFECFASIASALGPGFQEFAVVVTTRCLRIVENELLTDALYDQNPTQCEPGDSELLVCALDVISGVIEGLENNAEALLGSTGGPNGSRETLLNALKQCMTHEVLEVRQSAMGVLGDIAKHAPNVLLPQGSFVIVGDFLPVLIENIDPDMPTVCNNAMWCTGEIAMKIGSSMETFVPHLLSRLIPMIQRQRLSRNLVENCAIAIGRLAFVCPQLVAPHLGDFAKLWCRALAHIRSLEEKDECFIGLCYIIKLNPQGITSNFIYFCGATASLENSVEGHGMQHPELREMLFQIIHGFKDSMDTDTWNNYFQSFPPGLQQFLNTTFQL